MGGMIAQTIAIEHPRRVRSLTSIMSNTGSRLTGQPALRLYPVLLRRPPADREAWARHTAKVFEAIGGTGFHRDDDDLREIIELSYDRGHDPDGAARQLAAIVAGRDRAARLRRLRVPSLVIHGTDDRLVRPSGARATARAIPGSRLLLIDGMGHDLPRGAWPRIVGAIAHLAARTDGGRAPAAEAA
jgi:pimeloyl-ACP methyl ester carboxylesterase